jgi:hypothetical protein
MALGRLFSKQFVLSCQLSHQNSMHMLSGAGSIDSIEQEAPWELVSFHSCKQKKKNICGENEYSCRLFILFDSILDKTSVENISILELHKQVCLNRELILLKYTLN